MREPTLDGDRRRVSLMLSPKAEAMIDTMLSEGSDWMAARLAELSEDDPRSHLQRPGTAGKIAGVQPPQG